MSVRPYRDIDRRPSRQIQVGGVAVGGDAPISVQSMTNTITSDVAATVDQVRQMEDAGADIVRISCPDRESALALREIVREVTVPIVADIHFHYRRAIEAAESGAACLRINPGNIGSAERVREVIKAARDHGCSMRIGVICLQRRRAQHVLVLERGRLAAFLDACNLDRDFSSRRPHDQAIAKWLQLH